MLPSIADIEAATLNAWPALQVAHDRHWLWRGAKGFSKRANSIHCTDPTDSEDADARLERMVALSRYNNLPPVFRVTPLTSPGALAAIENAGWVVLERSLVLARTVADDELPVRHKVTLHDPRSPDWYEVQGAMAGYNPHTLSLLLAILDNVAFENCGITVHDDDGLPAGMALATVCNGIGIFLNVISRADVRGQGFGRSAMTAAFNWTRQAGATSAAMQVLTENPPALGLYGSLGFEQVYDYHYRVPAK